VCIDGHKAWRRYRVGGWGTMVDEHYCASLEECYEAHGLMERVLRGRQSQLPVARSPPHPP
jgi:hypothetical protein